QKRIEGSNYDTRKTVLEYDEVLRKQREIIYEQRRQVLFLDDISEVVKKMMRNVCKRLVESVETFEKKGRTIDYERLYEAVNGKYFPVNHIKLEELENLNANECVDLLLAKSDELLEEKKKAFSDEIIHEFLKVVLLRVIDTFWMEHIDSMSELRQAVRLQSYAQINPLREYQEVGFQKFETMIMNIESETMRYVNCAQIRNNLQREEVVKNTVASSGKEESTKRKPIKVENKIGRNDPCPCGSGKKYKNCCGRG
ncbi:MAG TPA: SEC-C metal-binding domain-containing protein, partial [Bacilli bacterium]